MRWTPLKLTLLLSCLGLQTFCPTVLAMDPPRLFLWGMGGSEAIGRVDALLPLVSNQCNQLFYGDVQGQIGSDSARYYGVGLGYRMIRNPELFGAYVFYDLNYSREHTLYPVVSPGIEFSRCQWDTRLNGYFPVSRHRKREATFFSTSDQEIFQKTRNGSTTRLPSIFYVFIVVPRRVAILFVCDMMLPLNERTHMFIRKKKNAGGTTSIMLLTSDRRPGKKHSNLRVIKNFGASSNEDELALLIQEAEEYKTHLIMVSPKAVTLKITSARDIRSCASFNVGFLDVYGKLFGDVFSKINLKAHELKKLHNLCVMRIAAPASKRKTAMISREYGIECGVDSIYKLMDQLTDNTITQTKKIIHGHTTELLKAQKETVDVMFYDLTTVYFETNSQDTLRDFGFSKDGKCQHVQIMLAVIVTKHGLPIDYEEFPGNCYEGHTLIPVIDKIKTRYHIDQVVLVADAALMNKINLSTLTEKKINYVIAARIKNTKKEIQGNILDQSGYKKVLSDKDDLIQAKTINLPTGGTLVAFHSSKRARKDKYDRQKDIERIEKYIQSTTKSQLTSRLKKPYVTISKSCKLEIDLDKLNHEKRFDGFFGIQTNLEKINPKEILSTYRGLWQVEQTFRIAKSNLEIRPVFHYNTKRIRAHFLICYMSLALIRYVEFALHKNNLHYPADQLHLLLEQMRVTKVHHADNNIYTLLEDTPPELIPIYQALNIKWHKKFSHQANL